MPIYKSKALKDKARLFHFNGNSPEGLKLLIESLDYLKEKYTLHIITNGFSEIQTKKMLSSKMLNTFLRNLKA